MDKHWKALTPNEKLAMEMARENVNHIASSSGGNPSIMPIYQEILGGMNRQYPEDMKPFASPSADMTLNKSIPPVPKKEWDGTPYEGNSYEQDSDLRRSLLGAKDALGRQTHRGMLGGVFKSAKELFGDADRMALLQTGLGMMNPNNYYDNQGFHSTMGGINRALGQGLRTRQALMKPRELGFKEQEAIKQKNAMALANAKLTPWVMNSRGQVLDTRTGKTRSPSGQAGMFLDANQIMNQEMKMGKDFATESSVERDQVDAYRRIEAIYADPMAELPSIDSPTVEGGIQLTKVLNPKTGDIFELDSGGSADLALIFNFMKMLDPDSVVREGEFALAEATGGFSETLKKEYAKVTSGQRLTPAMRRNIMRQARSQYNSAELNLRKKHKNYVKRGEQYKRWGIDAERALMYSPYQPTIPREAFRQPVVSVNGNNVDPNNSLGLRPRKQ